MAVIDYLRAELIGDFLTSRNGLNVPVGNLGIPRSAMPQIKDFKRFEDDLKAFDAKVIQNKRVRVGDIKLTQNEINKDKVFKLMIQYRKKNIRTRGGVDIDGFPPVISSDHFVLDGTHRHVAMLNIAKNSYHNYTMIDMPIRELYDVIKDNPEHFRKSVEYKRLVD